VTPVTAPCDLNHRSARQSQLSKSIAFFHASALAQGAEDIVFKDIEHLVRLAAVMLIALVGFVVLRAAVVPRSFGQYGHYRGAAIAEVAARPVSFAGHDTCEVCHTDVVDQKKQGRHIVVPCEACHGALARHADDPASVTPPKLDTAVLCARCHEANSAKPKAFPQVATADHSGGLACDTCHQPHRPKIDTQPETKATEARK
jgi:ABC-type nickel/cobalt efflux system permease component RcnA